MARTFPPALLWFLPAYPANLCLFRSFDPLPDGWLLARHSGKQTLMKRLRPYLSDVAAGETIKKLAKKYGVHRRMVRQAIAGVIPPQRKKHERKRTKIDAVREVIDRILETDRQAPRKQRHG